MNIVEQEVLRTLLNHPDVSQRELARLSEHSLGAVNRAVRELTAGGYLDDSGRPSENALRLAAENAPENAVILAAGFGMRMVPINNEQPKALLTVRGEVLIERQIRQLRAAGVKNIYVVVGFMKERFEYLIDEFGVRLIINPDYARKNNLHSMAPAMRFLRGGYIVPCDIWCGENPFSDFEPYSWYLTRSAGPGEGDARVNRRGEMTMRPGGGSRTVGIAYLTPEDAVRLGERVRALCADPAYDGAFWEAALEGTISIQAREARQVVEINTYEQLRELDSDSDSLHSKAIAAVAKVFSVGTEEITDIRVLKKGMTNRSFTFTCKGKRYVMRVPGAGTEKLIDRRAEVSVYAAIRGHGLCDDPVYIDADTGFKITAFLDNMRVCDADDIGDLRRCMEMLRAFHELGLQVEHTFDLFEQIEFYESLWSGARSLYRDHKRTKEAVLSLQDYIRANAHPYVLTHIDAIPDNFLIVTENGQESLQLIDWEYAGMQDPLVDVAMFCIYALYDRQQSDRLIDLYFDGACTPRDRTLIYCYMAVCGLLWSDWCEYKSHMGVEFGEYSLRQYHYAKEYSRLAKERMKDENA